MFAEMLAASNEGDDVRDPWVDRMRGLPTYLFLNRALTAAGLVDHVQLTLYPAISGQTGDEPNFTGATDLETPSGGAVTPHSG